MGEMRRAFYWATRSIYRTRAFGPPEVIFGMYAAKGGTTGEMVMRWHDLGGKLVPRLEVFADAWKTLYGFTDVLAALAERDGQDITEEQFIDILRGCGFVDDTPYEEV